MRQGAFAFNGNKPPAQPAGAAPARPQMPAGGTGMGAGTPPPPPSFLAQAMQQRGTQAPPIRSQQPPMAPPMQAPVQPGGIGQMPQSPLPSLPAMPAVSPRGRDMLAARVQARPVASEVGSASPPKERPAQFVAGVPGNPTSGMRLPEMLRSPEMMATLAERVKAWESENPKRKLMGSHIHAMLADHNVSRAQAGRIKKAIEKARRSMEVEQPMPADPWGRGALKAMKG